MSTDELKKEILRGNLTLVKDFVSYELIHGDPYEYYSILRYAIKVEAKRSRYREILFYLIESGRDVHFKLIAEVPLLVDALLCGCSYEVISELIKRGCDVNSVSEEGFTPLVYASLVNSDKKIVYELIRNGADVNHRDYCGRTPLFSVISKFKDPEIIKMFVNAGADITEHYEDGSNILMLNICICVENKNCVSKEMVDICINLGVDLKDIDKNGNNILHHTRCRYLLELAARYGVSFEAVNNSGQTALMLSVVEADTSKINYFLLRGANVNCVDFDLNTPLHLIAASEKSINHLALNYLLYCGANLLARNLLNKTPVDILCNKQYSHLTWYLLQTILKYTLLLDENAFKIAEGVFKKCYPQIFHIRFDYFITDCRQELDKMKSTYIKDDLTFYEFCVLRKFYKNKCVDISVDEFKYNCEEIKKLFPIYEDLVIIRIKDNHKKKVALVLRNSFEQITFRPRPNMEFNFDIKLNYDCVYYISRYLNRKDMYNLFSACINDTAKIYQSPN